MLGLFDRNKRTLTQFLSERNMPLNHTKNTTNEHLVVPTPPNFPRYNVIWSLGGRLKIVEAVLSVSITLAVKIMGGMKCFNLLE